MHGLNPRAIKQQFDSIECIHHYFLCFETAVTSAMEKPHGSHAKYKGPLCTHTRTARAAASAITSQPQVAIRGLCVDEVTAPSCDRLTWQTRSVPAAGSNFHPSKFWWPGMPHFCPLLKYQSPGEGVVLTPAPSTHSCVWPGARQPFICGLFYCCASCTGLTVAGPAAGQERSDAADVLLCITLFIGLQIHSV